MIIANEILKGQGCPSEYQENLRDLLEKINIIRKAYDKPMIVTSGYRTVSYELAHGRSGKSDHCKCKAVDIWDKDKELAKWCHENEDLLIKTKLWIEHTDYTKNWVHFTTQPKSKLFFIPY